MSTANHIRAFTGLNITEVARATGLERIDIYRAQEEAGLGAPGHFHYPKGELVFTESGLAALAEALPRIGKTEAGKLLRARITMEREAIAARAARRPGWLACWEIQTEERVAS